MLSLKHSSIFVVAWILVLFVSFVDSIESKSNLNVTLNSDSSHEDHHSKGRHLPSVPGEIDNKNLTVATNLSKDTNKTLPSNISNNSANFAGGMVTIATEGGGIILPKISKNTTGKVNVSKDTDNKSAHNIVTVVDVPTTRTPSTHTKSTSQSVAPSSTFTSSTTKTTRKPFRKKPLYTMVPSDKESKESDSFIESSTTGRDYVLPIVLCILALPLIGYLIKLIYRRGTEFTERQQYHRMYLIDGMYNAR